MDVGQVSESFVTVTEKVVKIIFHYYLAMANFTLALKRKTRPVSLYIIQIILRGLTEFIVFMRLSMVEY